MPQVTGEDVHSDFYYPAHRIVCQAGHLKDMQAAADAQEFCLFVGGDVAFRLRCWPPQAGAKLCRASAMRLRAQRREVLPNISASLRSEIGLPSWTLAR